MSVRSQEESPGVQQVAVEEECITRRHLHVQVGAAKLGVGGRVVCTIDHPRKFSLLDSCLPHLTMSSLDL